MVRATVLAFLALASSPWVRAGDAPAVLTAEPAATAPRDPEDAPPRRWRSNDAPSGTPFDPFSGEHAAALAATLFAMAGFAAAVRWPASPASARMIRRGLAAYLLLCAGGYVLAEIGSGNLAPSALLPLHLCDLSVFAGAYALATGHQLVFELLYFWGFSGTVLSVVAPALAVGFPDWRFLFFWGLHGGVLTAAALLTFGVGMRPRRGSAWKVFLVTNAYAGLAAIVNVLLGSNFLFLRDRPEWWFDPAGGLPALLAVSELVLLSAFVLLELPFRLVGERIAPAAASAAALDR